MLEIYPNPSSALDNDSLDAFSERLRNAIGKGKVGKAGDIKMALSACRFAATLPGQNIVNFSAGRVRDGRTEQHYKELQHSLNPDGIFQVGPKVASFYLRDLVSLLDLESYVPPEVQVCLQPVDVWVKRVCVQADLVPAGSDLNAVRGAIMRVCHEREISPILFNQGAWYMGYHALDILLKGLRERQSI